MEIKTLEMRIENGKKNLEKLNAKLERINVALAGGPNPYYYHESDLKSTTRDIACQKESLKKYQQMLEIELNKENAPKIEVLVKFLEQWKERASKFYHDEVLELHKMNEEYDAKKAQYIDSGCVKRDCYKEYSDLRKHHEWEIKHRFSYITLDLYRRSGNHIDEEKLEKILNNEVKNKYEDLVNRVTKVVGEIKDCGYLEIGDNGSINGRVIGSKAQAYVETIYAGGYNIQCLHYRVLVKPIKEAA